VLADDHAVIRESLKQLLKMEPNIRIVGETSDGEAAVELADHVRPDVVLINIDMPKLDGTKPRARSTKITQRSKSSDYPCSTRGPKRNPERCRRNAYLSKSG
jgi:DNA-binding NarL/FixJ family response regulator